ncbi:MAG: hypothetical protein ABFD14_11930 [Anaerolineaceae bacterium]
MSFLSGLFFKLPKEQVDILTKETPHYNDTRLNLAKEIAASGDKNAINRAAELLAKTINKLTFSGASQTYCRESMVECANGLIALGKPSVDHVLWVLDQQKDRGLYLFSQDAQLMLLDVLTSLHDIRAIPKLKDIMATAKHSDMFVRDKAKNTLQFLEALESSGLGKYM